MQLSRSQAFFHSSAVLPVAAMALTEEKHGELKTADVWRVKPLKNFQRELKINKLISIAFQSKYAYTKNENVANVTR